jgi:hypothetical protein
MAERLQGGLSRWARLVVLVAVWVAIYVCLANRQWPLVYLIGIAAILCLFSVERATGPKRTIPQAIVGTGLWAMASLLALVVLFFVVIVAATAGSEIGLWGSPWDGR